MDRAGNAAIRAKETSMHKLLGITLAVLTAFVVVTTKPQPAEAGRGGWPIAAAVVGGIALGAALSHRRYYGYGYGYRPYYYSAPVYYRPYRYYAPYRYYRPNRYYRPYRYYHRPYRYHRRYWR